MSYYRAMLLGVFSLLMVGCTPAQPIKTSSFEPPPGGVMADIDTRGPMGMLELGRVISHNAVDIYDPLATSFMVLPPSRAVQPKEGTIPYNRAVLVRDPDVRVYSLITRDSLAPVPTADPQPLKDPVPLKVD